MPQTPRFATLLAALSCASSLAAAATPATLPLYVGQPLPGASVMFGDFDMQQPLLADAGRMDSDPKLPGAVVGARRSSKAGPADALGLTFKDAWFATVRIQTPQLDLRPYLARGTVSFDLKVNELAKGGLAFRLACGAECTRTVSYVVPARAAQGKGWQHLSYRLNCFHRDGDDVKAVTQPFALDGTGAGDVELANVRIDARGTPNTTCPDYRTASVTPVPLTESWALDWWMPRHAEKLQEIAGRKAAGVPTGLVFIGDSITHHWEKDHRDLWDSMWGRYHPLNLGYGGDRTENVLWRLQHGELDGIAPKLIVLMIGTNNNGLRHDAPASTVAGIVRDIAEIRLRQPRAKLLLLAIFPRGATPGDAARRVNDRVNAMLPRLADGKHVFYLDINQAFLTPDGTLSPAIFPDLLHPNADGYQRWYRALAQEVDRLLR